MHATRQGQTLARLAGSSGIGVIFWQGIILSENRCTLFGIMLQLAEHDLFLKPIPLFEIML